MFFFFFKYPKALGIFIKNRKKENYNKQQQYAHFTYFEAHLFKSLQSH